MAHEAKLIIYACGDSSRLINARDRISEIVKPYYGDDFTFKISKYLETDENGELGNRDCIVGSFSLYNFDDISNFSNFGKEYPDLRWVAGAFYSNCGVAEFAASNYNSSEINYFNSDESNYDDEIRNTVGEYGRLILKQLDCGTFMFD